MTYDVAVVGSGFAGTVLARVLRRQGRRVLLLERGRHPRFALGESTTPLANLALERLAAAYDLPDLHCLATHGRWLTHLPDLRRGLKRGFTFYCHRRGEPYRNSAADEARLLVAASPDDAVADSHWLREDVDHYLVQRAAAEGVDYRDSTEVEGVEVTDAGVRLAARAGGRRRTFRAGWVVDASGGHGCLARALPIADVTAGVPVRSGLLYAHFAGLRPFVDVARAAGAVCEPGPYPDERAAVHHLLEEGWMYVLPFDHGPVSVGLVLRDGGGLSPEELRADPGRALRDLLAPYPTLAACFATAQPLAPVRHVARMQHRLAAAAGERWLLLPHAYAFCDPMYSTGIAWSLLAVERLAAIFAGRHGDPAAYAELLAREADQIERLIEASYLASARFDLFAAVTFLYFATVSFAELRQRLTPPPPSAPPAAWEGFLGAGDPAQRATFEETAARLREMIGAAVPSPGATAELCRYVRDAVAPRDVIGLGDPARRRRVPVDLDVLVERAHLLGLDREAIVAALPRLRSTA